MRPPRTDLHIRLHHKQGLAFLSEATEVLFGGAAGPGKSFLMRMALVLWCVEIPGLQCYLFRRISDDLIKNHMEGPKGLRSLLAAWEDEKAVEIVEGEIRFWNGSKIYLCHCKDEKDRIKYQGAEIHVLAIDELTHFTEVIYRFLRSRVRAVGLDGVPEKYRGRFPRILCASNPGGVGHQWVKMAFIDCGHAPMEMWRTPDDEGGMLRQYIPGRLKDNPSMEKDDPSYRMRLRGLGSAELVKAMEDGDWNVVSGAFFDEWETARHVIDPFPVPKDWIRFRSMDWGSAKPFSVGWWAVSDGSIKQFPRGALIRYREWYGAKKDDSGRTIPNVGLKMTARAVARGIKEREQGEEIAYGVLDPAAFAEDGQPSIAQEMAAEQVFFRRADNTRVAQRGAMSGWNLVRERLRGDGESPMVFVFNTCSDSIRTVPALQHDEARPEDLDSSAEDHCGDEWRYGMASRPWVHTPPEPPKRRDIWDESFGNTEPEDSWTTV